MRNPSPISAAARHALNTTWREHATAVGLSAADRIAEPRAFAPGPYAGVALVVSGPYGLRSLYTGHRARRTDPIRYVLADGDIRTSPARTLRPAQLTDTAGHLVPAAALDDALSDLLHLTHAAAAGLLRAAEPDEGVAYPRGSRR